MNIDIILLSALVILTYGSMAFIAIKYPKQVVDIFEKIKDNIKKCRKDEKNY